MKKSTKSTRYTLIISRHTHASDRGHIASIRALQCGARPWDIAPIPDAIDQSGEEVTRIVGLEERELRMVAAVLMTTRQVSVDTTQQCGTEISWYDAEIVMESRRSHHDDWHEEGREIVGTSDVDDIMCIVVDTRIDDRHLIEWDVAQGEWESQSDTIVGDIMRSDGARVGCVALHPTGAPRHVDVEIDMRSRCIVSGETIRHAVIASLAAVGMTADGIEIED